MRSLPPRQIYSSPGVGATEERQQDSRTEGWVGWRHPKWMRGGRQRGGATHTWGPCGQKAPRGVRPGCCTKSGGGGPSGSVGGSEQGRVFRSPPAASAAFGDASYTCRSWLRVPPWLPVPQERALVLLGPLPFPAQASPQARLPLTWIKCWALLLVLGTTSCPATPCPPQREPLLRDPSGPPRPLWASVMNPQGSQRPCLVQFSVVEAGSPQPILGKCIPPTRATVCSGVLGLPSRKWPECPLPWVQKGRDWGLTRG